jgi:hypothetical protein
MRRVSALLGFLALLMTALFAVSATAQARPLTAAAASADCGTAGYPFQPAATVLTSATNITVGEKIKVSGTGYCGDDTVTITIGGKTVGTAHTDSAGAFDPEVETPGPAGDVQLCGTGAIKVTAGSNSDCLTLHVSAAGAAPVTGGSGGGGTAMTGVQIGMLVGLAVLLVGGGAAFVLVGRTRRSLEPAER